MEGSSEFSSPPASPPSLKSPTRYSPRQDSPNPSPSPHHVLSPSPNPHVIHSGYVSPNPHKGSSHYSYPNPQTQTYLCRTSNNINPQGGLSPNPCDENPPNQSPIPRKYIPNSSPPPPTISQSNLSSPTQNHVQDSSSFLQINKQISTNEHTNEIIQTNNELQCKSASLVSSHNQGCALPMLPSSTLVSSIGPQPVYSIRSSFTSNSRQYSTLNLRQSSTSNDNQSSTNIPSQSSISNSSQSAMYRQNSTSNPSQSSTAKLRQSSTAIVNQSSTSIPSQPSASILRKSCASVPTKQKTVTQFTRIAPRPFPQVVKLINYPKYVQIKLYISLTSLRITPITS